MTTMMARVVGKGSRWSAELVVNGVVTEAEQFKTRGDANAFVTRAEGVRSFLRAATAPRYTRLDFLAWDAAGEVLRLRKDLEQALRSEAVSYVRDAERVANGGTPWYSEGNFVRSAMDLETARARYVAARDAFKNAAYAAMDFPDSYAGVAATVAFAFAGFTS